MLRRGWETHYPSLTLLSGVLLEISLAQPTRSREQESPFFFKGALALFFFIVLGLHCSLAAASRDYSVAGHRLLIVVASLVAEHRL